LTPTEKSNVRIRRVGPTDGDTYRDFRLRALEATPRAFTANAADERMLSTTDWFKRVDEPDRSILFGAFFGEGLVGIAGLRFEQERQARHKGTLFGMAVDQSVARQGIGGALVACILQEAKHRGLQQVVLTYSEGNGAAERLYTRHGFVAFGCEPRAVIVQGQDVAKVHMICMLDAAIGRRPEPMGPTPS
jgi:GNAT superfamily N-acetyltransferase